MAVPLHLLPALQHRQLRAYSTKAPALPHLTPTGTAHMVPIHDKPITTRTAAAVGRITFSNPTPIGLILRNANKKGDVLALARISGILAAKKCPELVVLCHPIAISSVEVEVEVDSVGGCIDVRAVVTCDGKTGVEMEALTAVMGAALAVVDMCKAVDRGIVVGGVRVVEKRGGRSGDWVAE